MEQEFDQDDFICHEKDSRNKQGKSGAQNKRNNKKEVMNREYRMEKKEQQSLKDRGLLDSSDEESKQQVKWENVKDQNKKKKKDTGISDKLSKEQKKLLQQQDEDSMGKPLKGKQKLQKTAKMG